MSVGVHIRGLTSQWQANAFVVPRYTITHTSAYAACWNITHTHMHIKHRVDDDRTAEKAARIRNEFNDSDE